MQMCASLDSFDDDSEGILKIQISRACCKYWRLVGFGRTNASVSSARICLQEHRRPK
jgi:hypothetical protein